MWASVMRAVYRQSRERASHALAGAAVLCLSLTLGACVSTPMPGLVSMEDMTGSIPASTPEASPLPVLSGDDWIFASKALASALDPQGVGSAVAWESASSGVHGSMTPVGAVYEADGQTCRAFLAEISGRASMQRLQGRGCRQGRGAWAVSDLRPFGS